MKSIRLIEAQRLIASLAVKIIQTRKEENNVHNFEFLNSDYPLIIADHLSRKAIIYVRESAENTGSRAISESQVQFARAYGWPEHLIEVIEDDLGKSGASTGRSGWQRMLANIATNSVGIVFAISVSRLTRQVSAYEQLRSLAADHGTLFCIGNRITDPSYRLWRDQ